MWNHYETAESERTNNYVEGDNHKMKCFCGAANPNIDKAVNLLRSYETTSEAKYKNAKKSTAKPPYKNYPITPSKQICFYPGKTS